MPNELICCLERNNKTSEQQMQELKDKMADLEKKGYAIRTIDFSKNHIQIHHEEIYGGEKKWKAL